MPDNIAAEPRLRILDRVTVERCAASIDPVEVVESLLREHASGATVLPAEAYMEWRNSADAYCRSIAMPGGVLFRGERVYGMKIINAAVSNLAIGLDRAGGVTMLFDPETARPCVLADAGYLSALRTAAYTLVSLRHLAPQVFESASIVGCGALAREHLRMLAVHHPSLSTVYVYDIDPGRAEALAAWAKAHLPDHAVVPCATACQAVGASNVVITLTTSRHPYIEPDWFQPGSFVAHVSLDDVTEGVFLEAEAIFVDDLTLVQDNTRRILGRLMAEGKIGKPNRSDSGSGRDRGSIRTLGDVIDGRYEAIRPQDGLVVSNPFGMSILDIGLLARVAEIAETKGSGQYVPIFTTST